MLKHPVHSFEDSPEFFVVVVFEHSPEFFDSPELFEVVVFEHSPEFFEVMVFERSPELFDSPELFEVVVFERLFRGDPLVRVVAAHVVDEGDALRAGVR